MGILNAALSLFGKGSTAKDGRNGRSEEVAAPGSKSTILVIDDDLRFLETMRILLRGAGYNVLTSSTGPKGLDTLRYAPRDVRAVLLEADPDRVEEDEDRESDYHAGGCDGDQDDAESLRGAEVHCPIVTPGGLAPGGVRPTVPPTEPPPRPE